MEQEELDTTIEICRGCGRRGDGLGLVMPQIVCTNCGDSYHWLCAAVKKSRCGSEWFCTRCKGKQLEEVTKLIYKAWLGSAKNREVDTDDFWTSLSQSEALEAVLVNGEGSDAMKDSSVSDESIEALEEWLKKN